MQFNGQTNNLDICTSADDFNDSNDVSFPLEQKARYATIANNIIWSWIFQVFGGWQYQDTNDTTDPWADINVLANITKLDLPSAAITVTGVGRLDTVNNEYVPLKPITLEMIQERGYTLQNYHNISSFPDEYLLIGNQIYIFPAFKGSTALAIRVYFDRGSSGFILTDTTKTPGFVSEFHPAVACYMGLRYAEAKNKDNAAQIRKQWSNEKDGNSPDGWEQVIKKFYKARWRQMYPGTLKGSRDVVHEYI